MGVEEHSVCRGLYSPWLTLLNRLLALIWFVVEHRTQFLSSAFVVVAFPLFLVAEFYVLAKGCASTLLYLMFVASLLLWFGTVLAMMWIDGDRLEFSSEHVFVGVAIFVLAYAARGWLHMRQSAKAKDFASVLSLWTLSFVLLSMLVLSYDAPCECLLSSDWSRLGSIWSVIVALAAAALWIESKIANLQLLLGFTVVCGATMGAVVATRTVGANVDPVRLLKLRLA